MWSPPSGVLSLAPAHFLEGLQHVGSSSLQPTPSPLPTEGLWGCCTSSRSRRCHEVVVAVPLWLSCNNISATAFALQAQQPLYYSSTRAAAHQPSPCYQYTGYGGATPVLPWLWQLSYCSCHASAFQLLLSRYKHSTRLATAAVVCSSLQPTPTLLLMQGLWERCSSNLPAAAAAIVQH